MKIEIMGKETLDKLSTSALEEIRNLAYGEVTEIRASFAGGTPDAETVESVSVLASYIATLDETLDEREAAEKAFNVEVKPRSKKVEAVEAANTPVAEPEFDDKGVKNVADKVVPVTGNGETAAVIEASVTVGGTPTIADVAPYVPKADVEDGSAPKTFSIVAAAPLSLGKGQAVAHNAEMDWDSLAKAFMEAADGNMSKARHSGGVAHREHTRLASIRREATADRVLLDTDTPQAAYEKLKEMSNRFGADVAAGRTSVEAANGFCTPSTPIYDTCSPITATGLLNAPRMVVPRGGIIHNQGLDFSDFFGGDFVLPIPGYNILTEAQVIADTAKTCFEIPCPPFVDDRLNIAALCLTGSILQNRTYPEFVSTFVEGSIAAMAHLVNREVINAIVTGSTAVPLAAFDPWVTDGTVLSQVMSAVEMAVVDLRYAYRTDPNQLFTVVLPIWILAQLRADYIRQNARANNDIADSELASMFRTRGALVQYVYDWQDAFNPTGTTTIPTANQAGHATPIVSLPFNLGFLIYLPGTWVIGELDIISLSMVYDSTLLAQNQVTQLFMEDGFKPMRMCQFSRVYTVNICPSGSTGAQRAVACADITG